MVLSLPSEPSSGGERLWSGGRPGGEALRGAAAVRGLTALGAAPARWRGGHTERAFIKYEKGLLTMRKKRELLNAFD